MDIDEIIKKEEDLFYERYCHDERRAYKNITLYSTIKKFISSLMTNGGQRSDDNIYRLERFWDEFLKDNTTIIICIHFINIVLLIVTVVFLARLEYSLSIIYNCVVWIVISAACLSCIILYKSVSLSNISGNGVKAITIWSNVGYYILYLRCLQMIIKVVKAIAIGNSDYMSNAFDNFMPVDVKRIDFLFLMIGTDLVQLVVFSTVPFPTPINFYFCIQELLLQIVRVCLSKKDLHDNVSGNYLFVCTLVTVIFMHYLVLTTVAGVEFMFKNSFKNLRGFEVATLVENRFVNLICSDAKSIVYDLSRAVENIVSLFPDAKVINLKNASKLIRQSEKINIVADNLLLLIKINDNQLNAGDSLVNIRQLISKVQADRSFSNLQMQFNINLQTDICRDVITNADGVYMLLKNILVYCYERVERSGYESQDLDITCVMVKATKRINQKLCQYMLIFKIKINRKTADSQDTAQKYKLKPKRRSNAAKVEITETKLVALMSLAAQYNGYCQINDTDTSSYEIELGIGSRGLSSVVHPGIEYDKVSGKVELSRTLKVSIPIKAYIVTADFIKLEMLQRLLQRVGIKPHNIGTSKSLEILISRSDASSKKSNLMSVLSSDVVIVDSITNCNKLAKYNSFSGLLVLVSDESHYDNELVKRKKYHYRLPLYCLELDAINFGDWLSSQMNETSNDVLRRTSESQFDILNDTKVRSFWSKIMFNRRNDIGMNEDKYFRQLSYYKDSTKELDTQFIRKFAIKRKFDYSHSYLGVLTQTFNKHVEETYMKVRSFNPTNCWIHPSTGVYWVCMLYFVHQIMIKAMGTMFLPQIEYRLLVIITIIISSHSNHHYIH